MTTRRRWPSDRHRLACRRGAPVHGRPSRVPLRVIRGGEYHPAVINRTWEHRSMDRSAWPLRLALAIALIAWLFCAGWAGKQILDDQLSDTTIHSSVEASGTTPGGQTFSVRQNTSSTITGPSNATSLGSASPLNGVVPSLIASTTAPASTASGEEPTKETPTSTAPSNTTPGDDGGGGSPVISTDGPGGADVTFFAFLLLIGAGLFTLVLRALGSDTLVASADANEPSASVGDDAIAILEAAARAVTAQRRAGLPPRDELSDLYARQTITAARETGVLAERLATRLRTEQRISAKEAADLERLASNAASVSAPEERHG